MHPCPERFTYPFQQSEITVVPGSIHCLIRFSKVSSFRSPTVAMKHLHESSSMLPKTHWPSTTWPRWYFLFQFYSHLYEQISLVPLSSSFNRTAPTHTLLAKHVSVNSCVRAKLQLLFYLPLVQVLAPPICKFQHLFNCQVRFFKPTSLSNAPLTSVPFTVDLPSTLPDVAIGPVSTLKQLHCRSTNRAHSTWCERTFVL